MNILFTVCGRAGSKGIKNKNIKDFLGLPLPLYSLSAINLFIKSHPEYVCEVVVNTDSQELIRIMQDAHLVDLHVIERVEDLSGDRVAKIDVIQDSYHQMQDKLNKQFDYVVDLDITSPIRRIEDIEALVAKMLDVRCDLVLSVAESRRNPYFNMVMKAEHKDGYIKVIDSPFIARQQAPDIYDINGSLYMYSASFLDVAQNLFDGHIEVIEMLDTGVLDLDREIDFLLMEIVGKHFFFEVAEYKVIRDNISSGGNMYGSSK